MVRINLTVEGEESAPLLPSIQFSLSQEAVENLFAVLDAVQRAPRTSVTVGMIEHTRDALWLLNKVLSDSGQTLALMFG